MSLSYGFCLGEENTQYDSGQFAEAFQAIVGDGVCPFGGKLRVSSTDTMTVSLLTGFALLGGRWFKSDEAMPFTVLPADNNFDRYDAVVLRADLVRKEIAPVIIKGNAAALPEKYTPIRDANSYEIILCYILVRMGTTQILSTDIVDTRADSALCGMITQLSDISEKVLKVYKFLESGIDERVDSLADKANVIIKKGSSAIESIESAMAAANISKAIGEIEIFHQRPKPEKQWLKCDGSLIPQEYTVLSKLLGGKLPNLVKFESRFSPWIFAGSPKSLEE